ncbi:hypothetical protein D3C71_1501360 [compost metagenome]
MLVNTRLSSSTTSTFNRGTCGVSASVTADSATESAPATGNQSSAVVPFSFSLLSMKRPPICSIKPCTIDSPSPVPLPTPLVVKNGSIADASVLASMPSPVSVTLKQT